MHVMLGLHLSCALFSYSTQTLSPEVRVPNIHLRALLLVMPLQCAGAATRSSSSSASRPA